MDAKTLEGYRRRLEEARRALAGEVVARTREGFELGTDAVQDMADEAANTYARQVLLGLSERERRQLLEIDGALARIDRGEYGICEACGEPIAPARLEALPYATLCVECKANQERGQA